MKTDRYKKLLETTIKYNTIESQRHSVTVYLKNIIEVATQMQYEQELLTVNKIIETYGTIKTGKVGDNKKFEYLSFNVPLQIKENIKNLMYHVYNKREQDVAENIVHIK